MDQHPSSCHDDDDKSNNQQEALSFLQQQHQQQKLYVTPDSVLGKKRPFSTTTITPYQEDKEEEEEDADEYPGATTMSLSLPLSPPRQEQEPSLLIQERVHHHQHYQQQEGVEHSNDDKVNTALPSSLPLMHNNDNDEDSQQQQQQLLLQQQEYAPPTTRLRDIVGHAAIKLRLDEILLPLALPTAVTRRIWTGLRAAPTAILLFGPPGCGKTRLAAAVAGEAQAAYLPIGPSDILSKFVGEAEAAVRHVFTTAWRLARTTESRTTVVFWDEIDALGQARGGNGTTGKGGGGGGGGDTNQDHGGGSGAGAGRGILAELLLQCNRLQELSTAEQQQQQQQQQHNDHEENDDDNDDAQGVPSPRVLFMAATNRPEDVDAALLRRFGLRLYVGVPTEKDRRKLLRHFLCDIEHSLSRVQLRQLAAATDGWSGSELEHLTREAVMAPVRECLQAAARQRRRHGRKRRVVKQSRTSLPSRLHAALNQNVQNFTESSQERHSASSSTTCPIQQGDQIKGCFNESNEKSGNHNDNDDVEHARRTLLARLKDLRPVTLKDFSNAIDFILNQTSPEEAEALLSPDTRASLDQGARYDSSSSSSGYSTSNPEEEEEEDEEHLQCLGERGSAVRGLQLKQQVSSPSSL